MAWAERYPGQHGAGRGAGCGALLARWPVACWHGGGGTNGPHRIVPSTSVCPLAACPCRVLPLGPGAVSIVCLWAGTAGGGPLGSISSAFWAPSCGDGRASCLLARGPGPKKGGHSWMRPHSRPQGAPGLARDGTVPPGIHGVQGSAARGRADRVVPQLVRRPAGKTDFEATGPTCPTPQRRGVFPRLILIKLCVF